MRVGSLRSAKWVTSNRPPSQCNQACHLLRRLCQVVARSRSTSAYALMGQSGVEQTKTERLTNDALDHLSRSGRQPHQLVCVPVRDFRSVGWRHR
jgi:hypothetical protein